MNAFQFGQMVREKTAAGPGMFGSAMQGMQNAGKSMMQGAKRMGTAANNWSAKNLGLAMPNKAELGASYTNAANNALASKPGQMALGGAAHVYNNYAPQAAKNYVSSKMPTYYGDQQEQQVLQQGGVKNIAPQPFQTHRQDVGSYVDTSTRVENDQLAHDRIDAYTPATNFGTPLQQIGYGLSNKEMPGQTFKPGDTATQHTGVLNDQISHQRLLPGQYDQQPAAALTNTTPPQSFGQRMRSMVGL
jgi:hypothetical protein